MTVQTLADRDEARRAYRWTCALADTLVATRRRFGGDLDQYLLYMTVVQAEVDRSLRRGACVAAVNALSLAETCGVARETARSKIRRLVDAGVLTFGRDSLVRLSDPAAARQEYAALAPIAGSRP